MRKIIFLLFLSISNIVYSQEYLNFKDCKTENDFNNYFQKNILSLDPLEGIYIIKSGYIRSAQGYGENRILGESNIAIVKDNDGNFYKYIIIIHARAISTYQQAFIFNTTLHKQNKFL